MVGRRAGRNGELRTVMNTDPQADVCLVLEGTYPFVAGGVSTWTHDLLLAQSHLTFHLVCLVPANADPTPRYTVPPNVIGITRIAVGSLPDGAPRLREAKRILERIEEPLLKLQNNGGLAEVRSVLNELAPLRAYSGTRRTAFRGEAEQDSGLIPNSIPGARRTRIPG